MNYPQIFKYSLICLSLSFFLGCKQKETSKVYGHWTAIHIIKDNKEILNNNIRVNGEHVTYADGVRMSINPGGLSILLDPSVLAHVEIDEKDEIEYLRIYDATDPGFNGLYFITIETRQQNVGNSPATVYYMKMESDNCIIYLKRGLFKT